MLKAFPTSNGMNFSPVKILEDARIRGYAVGQFNVSNLEQIRAVCETAVSLKSPVILGTSEGERKFIGLKQIVAVTRAWQEETGLPIILNADHSKSYESATAAYDVGYTAIHFDGSEMSFEKNLEITKQIVDFIKVGNPDTIVEGELGRIPGSSQIHDQNIILKESDFTDPELAAKFVKETGVDSLAISFGNIHGMFGKGAESSEKLDTLRLKAIREKIEIEMRRSESEFHESRAFLVLHGGSGISGEEIKESIQNGIVKVNINTELRVAYVDALREALALKGRETTPYKIWPPAIEAVKKVVEEKMRLFGSINRI